LRPTGFSTQPDEHLLGEHLLGEHLLGEHLLGEHLLGEHLLAAKARRVLRPIGPLLLVLFCLVTGSQFGLGQAVSTSPADNRVEPKSNSIDSDQSSDEAKIRAIIEKLRTAVKNVKIAEITYITGTFDESDDNSKAYEKAIADGRKILNELQDQALPFLIKSSSLSDEWWEMGKMLMYGLYDDHQYERCYQIATHLNQLSPNEDVQWMIMRSAMLTNRFEIAAEFREKVPSRVPDLPKLELSMMKSLPELTRIGVEERKQRALDEQRDLPQVQLVTSEGTIILELFEDQYPETVGHFIHLVEQKFYDNLVFHRVTKNYLPYCVIQSGVFSLTPVPEKNDQAWFAHKIDYRIKDEKPEDGIVRRHLRGVISLPLKMNKDRNPIPDSAGSEFLITLVPTPVLDGHQVVFGRVIEGLEVIDRFPPTFTVSEEDGSEKQLENPQFGKILEAKVLRKRNHEYLPNKITD
jgi:cyclophilin family peptidyl-prolyl cis-trans isomerase